MVRTYVTAAWLTFALSLGASAQTTPQVGARVLGQWSDRFWYPAHVEAVSATEVRLAFDDGDTRTVTADQVRPLDWTARTRVQCNWQGRGTYYPGLVGSREGDTVSIRYDDGDAEQTMVGKCRSATPSAEDAAARAPAEGAHTAAPARPIPPDPQPIRVYNGDLIGFVDAQGNEVLPMRGWALSTFHGGRARWIDRGYVDRTGRLVIETGLDPAEDFSEGRAAVRVGAQWGFIDTAGAWVVSPQFDDAWTFSDGRAYVLRDSAAGYIDRTGTLAIKPRFEAAQSFKHGLAAVRLRDTWGLIDTTGAWVVPTAPGPISSWSTTLVCVNLGPGVLVLNHSGQWAFPRAFENVVCDDGPSLLYRSGGVWGLLGATGETIVSARWADARAFSEGLAAVKVDSLWGFVDVAGTMALPARWPWVGDFDHGTALVGRSSYEVEALITQTGDTVWTLPSPVSARAVSRPAGRRSASNVWTIIERCQTDPATCDADFMALVFRVTDVNHPDDDGITPLMHAAASREVGMVLAFLRHGADVKAVAKNGSTALHFAAAGDAAEVIPFLLKAGADLEARSEGGITPLLEAAAYGSDSAAAILIAAGADVGATSTGFPESLGEELARVIDADEPETGFTALHLAAMGGHAGSVQRLIRAGASVDVGTSLKNTPLMLAASEDQDAVIPILVESHASLEAKNDLKHTALTYAVASQAHNAVWVLLAAGAKANARGGPENLTPLHWAALADCEGCVDPLVEHGADVRAKARGFTPRELAAAAGHSLVAEYIRLAEQGRR